MKTTGTSTATKGYHHRVNPAAAIVALAVVATLFGLADGIWPTFTWIWSFFASVVTAAWNWLTGVPGAIANTL